MSSRLFRQHGHRPFAPATLSRVGYPGQDFVARPVQESRQRRVPDSWQALVTHAGSVTLPAGPNTWLRNYPGNSGRQTCSRLVIWLRRTSLWCRVWIDGPQCLGGFLAHVELGVPRRGNQGRNRGLGRSAHFSQRAGSDTAHVVFFIAQEVRQGRHCGAGSWAYIAHSLGSAASNTPLLVPHGLDQQRHRGPALRPIFPSASAASARASSSFMTSIKAGTADFASAPIDPSAAAIARRAGDLSVRKASIRAGTAPFALAPISSQSRGKCFAHPLVRILQAPGQRRGHHVCIEARRVQGAYGLGSTRVDVLS